MSLSKKEPKCQMCGSKIYSNAQISAMGSLSPIDLMIYDTYRGYRCKSCKKTYCKACLEKKAPSNGADGKACPSCYGSFEYL